MTFLTVLGVFNYGLVLIYGLFLSVFIAGGWEKDSQRRLIFALCPVLLLIQSVFWLLLGENIVKGLYPLIVHLPLVLGRGGDAARLSAGGPSSADRGARPFDPYAAVADRFGPYGLSVLPASPLGQHCRGSPDPLGAGR